MIDRSDRFWYKDAVIYQTHVKAFHDADNDGIGDFAGLAQKLDYIQELGVTALWLLPFYPSPLKDDGYDIADYRDVNPRYGTLRDFRNFVRECHARGIRVITELVVNHTSDQHPWFQRARRAPKGHPHRNFYVWSDTDQKYQGTRIIFLDTEKSNWTWDEQAKAYFWHRFYSHQPDLNFDNPRVLREVMNVMRYWLDMGVDGLRLDAVPYLIEREGTNCENLPETHEILRRIRAEVDSHYGDRMLLAEANQWPEDVLPYFGNPEVGGDECHMAFHFPLMPRIYMALAMEDRHPVTDIMRQTPEIPANAQWAVFLRNHDELTLEMVTDKERDYMWNFYATDRRARINLGIRRRLAPLMDNDRHKIELLNSLLFSMPGTPVIYYGDEIGMGDNVYLGDRDGVRTPMQWSPDRNGGFSRADPAGLYLPTIQDPVYGFQAVNVEAQARSSTSLLNWMRRLVAVRQQYRAFGRGSLRFLYPGNRKVLAYLREYEGEVVLCVANLSRAPQAVELDLRQHRTCVPVEMIGRSAFPPIGDLPYLLTLPGYGFYWFVLSSQAALPTWHEPVPEPLPDFVTLVLRDGWREVVTGRGIRDLETEALPAFVPKQRWFGAKDARVTGVRVTGTAELPDPTGGGESYLLTRIDVSHTASSEPVPYFLPLAMSWEEQAGTPGWPLFPFTVARTRRGARLGAAFDAMQSSRFALALVEAVRKGLERPATRGSLLFLPTDRLDEVRFSVTEPPEVRTLGVEQSNTSVLLGDQIVLKIYRRLEPGSHPELEMARFLTERVPYANTPPLLGTIEHRLEGDGTALAVLTGFVRNQGNGWTFTLDYLTRELEDARLHLTAGRESGAVPPVLAEVEGENFGMYLTLARTLGERTAQLHCALATTTGDPGFDPEPAGAADMEDWREAAMRQVEAGLHALRTARDGLPDEARAAADLLLGREEEVFERVHALARPIDGLTKTRIHGDYHLGQVLRSATDWFIIDFEGEPTKTLAERRRKHSPLRDVAGMLRSFDYAAWGAMFRLAEVHADAIDRLGPLAREWNQAARTAFLEGYDGAIGACSACPQDGSADRLRALFELEKAFYEIAYEAGNRPTWLPIPIRGALAVLDRPLEMPQ
ncbi:maltose alpha-D-glucosyltransferase [Rhodospirillum centenum]|uniref:Maltokinase n=1 Tax=Rhodospirillum centenum (strain ATCC 51521 / SW) TaxID=414684 RepID=B6IR67_RHOCS|nr:maltose alpha-D-glucosyltransferase [Rhodospirillum centenum]ACI97953.1 trehalose synthase [Rhodospirillum centenum SW]